MPIAASQMPAAIRGVIDDQLEIFRNGASVTVVNKIPDTPDIPVENPNHWLRVPDVVCVFVDLKNSTALSARTRDKTLATIYQLWTGTAVRIFHEMLASYIDVKGDGVFALFNQDEPNRALAAAVTFKTFANDVFLPEVAKSGNVSLGSHIGVDVDTVLVRKVGLKRSGGRSDRQNEVWAGKPINMAAKLASVSQHNEILVSDRFHSLLHDDLVLVSCGCPTGDPSPLWTEVDVAGDSRFDFHLAHRLTSNWCQNHGENFCRRICDLDN